MHRITNRIEYYSLLSLTSHKNIKGQRQTVQTQIRRRVLDDAKRDGWSRFVLGIEIFIIHDNYGEWLQRPVFFFFFFFFFFITGVYRRRVAKEIIKYSSRPIYLFRFLTLPGELRRDSSHCKVRFIIHLIIRVKWLYRYDDFIWLL